MQVGQKGLRTSSSALCLCPTLGSCSKLWSRDVRARHDFHQFLLYRKLVGREVWVAADSLAGRWGIKMERADMQVPGLIWMDVRLALC
ncbi:unnamed protein product [Boreogadus saida]